MNLDFEKYANGLVPAVVQDANTGMVLMHAYVNREAYEKMLETGLATFYSRSRQRLWTKGETSGYTLLVKDLHTDCDNDALLIVAEPAGPICHLGTQSCFGTAAVSIYAGLSELEEVVAERLANPQPKSYVAELRAEGVNRIAQKMGEEAVETVIASLGTDDEKFISEAADLLFHLIVLLQSKGHSLRDVTAELNRRRR